MDWPTGLLKRSSYDRRNGSTTESHSTNGTAPPPRADVQRALAVETEPIADNGQQTTDNRGLLEGVEASFGTEAAQVERDALETARSWAEKGLPRHDLEVNGRLDVEEMLAHRTSHVFSDWARRMRDRVEGALQSESEQIGASLLALEQRLLRYKYLLDELRGSRVAVVQAQSQDEQRAAEAEKAPRRRVAYAARLGSVPFWLLCATLVLADFVANVPVFNELLPSSPVAAQALQNIETNAAANPDTYGWQTFWARLGMHLDASILAFSVVLFLVVLGHFFGSALRTIVALHRARPIVDEELLHKHRHQPTVVAWFSLAGILTIVTVLFLARAGIESASRERLERGEAAVVAKQQQVTEAQQRNDPTLVQQLDVERQTLEAQVPVLRARHEYAVSIASINWPIAALNLVLALCAALLAYQHQSENLELDPTHSARAPTAREHYRALRTSVEDERGHICALASDIDTRIRRTRHLAESRPLLRADGKAARLRGVIPMFRAENARARGLDTRSILAFQSPIPDVIPDVDESAFELPDAFEDSLARYGNLQSRFLELEGEREAAAETIA